MANTLQRTVDEIAKLLRERDEHTAHANAVNHAAHNAVRDSYRTCLGTLHGNFLNSTGDTVVHVDEDGLPTIIVLDDVNELEGERREVMYGI